MLQANDRGEGIATSHIGLATSTMVCSGMLYYVSPVRPGIRAIRFTERLTSEMCNVMHRDLKVLGLASYAANVTDCECDSVVARISASIPMRSTYGRL